MDLLSRDNVQICDRAGGWREAVRRAVTPLERSGAVEPRYKEEIIRMIGALGPYVVIGEDVALIHAGAEQGVIETRLAVTLFREPIRFGGTEMTPRLFIALAAKDPDTHLDALKTICELCGNEETLSNILNAPDADTLYHFFQSLGGGSAADSVDSRGNP